MSIGIQKRGSRTIEKHGEIEATEKHSKQFQVPSSTSWKGKGKPKMQSQGKSDGPGDRQAILTAG
jgi:hypothetical protein